MDKIFINEIFVRKPFFSAGLNANRQKIAVMEGLPRNADHVPEPSTTPEIPAKPGPPELPESPDTPEIQEPPQTPEYLPPSSVPELPQSPSSPEIDGLRIESCFGRSNIHKIRRPSYR